MKTVTTIEELFKEIESDKKTRIHDRYPIRFIFLSSIPLLKNVVKEFDRHDINTIELTEFLPHADGWLTVHEIVSHLIHINKDCVVVPVSELVRFYNKDDFVALFNRLSEIENTRNKQRRFYIPLVGIYERFNHEFYRFFYRQTEWAPIWQVIDDASLKNKIYIIDFNVDKVKQVDFIRNTKDWLNIWKKDDLSNLLCSSKNLSFLCKNTLPDQVFDIEEIRNLKELLFKVYGIEIPINYLESDKPFWEKLFEEIKKIPVSEFSQLVRKLFGVENIKQADILGLWTKCADNFCKWLIKHYVTSQNDWVKSYLYCVMQEMQDIDDSALCKKLWLSIFKLEKTKAKYYFDERHTLLKQFYELKHNFQRTFIEEELKAELDKIGNFNEKLKLLTDITELERKTFLEMVSKDNVNIESLKERYPDLYYYLSDMTFDNLPEDSWIIDYFKEYRFSKLKDTIQPELNSLLQVKNESSEYFYKWYYSFRSVTEILKYEEVSKILLIDALGLEWMPYFCTLIEKICGLTVEKKYVARANLPSITECNKIQNAIHIQSYDKEMIHSDYKYPDALVQQLSFLKDIARKYVYVSNNEKVAITSDHGTTALARLGSQPKSYNFSDSSHEGRCMWLGKREEVDDKNILMHEIDNPSSNFKKYSLVALNYTSLYNRPRREVHGGGTPEEILIPIIIVAKSAASGDLFYTVYPKEVHLTKREAKLLLDINPKPKKQPQLLLDNKEIGVFRYDSKQNKWHIKLDKLKSGHYNMAIKIGEWQDMLTVEIKGGMRESDLL